MKQRTGTSRYTLGFTIVEVLIVVIVVAILASVTVVAYTGIQNRAHDSAVKSDLSTMQKRFELYYNRHGFIPATSPQLANALESFKPAQQSYAVAPTTNHNLIHCRGVEPDSYAIVALSKSGNGFYITHNGAMRDVTIEWSTQTPLCTHAVPGEYAVGENWRGYAGEDTTNGPWRSWTGITNP